jgi:Cu-Zn family superoxide dismutase
VVTIYADTFQSGVSADITIQETDTEITIKGRVQGLPSNTTHNKFGFHIHEHPFKDNDCTTAGTHFNPTNSKHGEQESILGNPNL